MKAAFKFLLRFIVGICLLFLLLFLVISLVLFVPKVQTFVSHKASSYVSDKIGTPVDIHGIYLQFPNGVSIEKLYLEDQSADTLLYTGKLKVAIDYFALIHSEVEISSIILENTTANIYVKQDNTFNFDYILDAFTTVSGDAETEIDSSSSTLSFDIGTIELNNVRFSYTSEPDGMRTSYSIGQLKVDVDEFDLKNQIFTASSIDINHSSGSFEIFKSVPSTPDTITKAVQLIVGSDEFNVSETHFKFIDRTTETSFSANIGELKLAIEPIDLAKQIIKAKSLKLNDSDVKLSINSKMVSDSTVTNATNIESESQPWLMSLESLDINNFNFSFDDLASPKTQKGIDYAHLGLKISELNSNAIYFNGIQDLGLELSRLEAYEQSGLQINQAAFVLKMDSTSISTQQLILQTPQTSIDAAAVLEFNNLDSIANQLAQLKVVFKAQHTKIGLSDLLYFTPDLDTMDAISPYFKQSVNVDGEIAGSINDLDFKNFRLKVEKSSQLLVDGNIKGLPETNNLAFNFKQLQLITNRDDLINFLPDSTIPTAIKLPAKIKMDLSAQGNLKDIKAQLKLSTSYGNITSDLALQQADSKNAKYQIKLQIPQFDLARLLQDSTLGNLAFNGKINGHGLSVEKMDLKLDATVSDFDYQNYRYSDLIIKGALNKESFEGDINMNDSNLIFAFNGKVDLDSLNPAFDFTFKLDGADLQRLNIAQNDYRIKGTIGANFTGNSLENLNGNLDVRNVLIIYKGKQYHIDSLLFLSIVDSGKTDISIQSNLMDAAFKGNIYISELAKTLENHFKGKLSDTVQKDNIKPQDFNFSIKVKDPDLLTEVFVPELNSFETGEIKGHFDSEKDILELEANFPKIDYSNIIIDSLRLTANSDSSKFISALQIKRISYDTLSVNNITLEADVEQNKATLSLQILDELQDKILQLKGNLIKPKENLEFHFTENEQYLNSNPWIVNSTNEIIFGDSTIFKQVEFSNDSQKIGIETINKFHEVQFSNFKLSTIFNIISQNQEQIGNITTSYDEFRKKNAAEKDSTKEVSDPLLRGILNGKIKFPTDSLGYLNAQVDIQQLKLSEIALGNLQVNYSEQLKRDSMLVLLSGNGNDIKLNGYLAKDEMNFQLNIDKLKMDIIEAFSGDQISNTAGYLTANANFDKKGESISSEGEISFEQVKLKSKYLGETYYLNNDKIKFNNDKIILHDFTILDSAKNSFVTNGSIGITDVTNPILNLSVKIDHFKFLNTSKASANDLFYGTVLASANLKINGNLQKPKVNAKLNLEDGTDITFVVPSEEASEVDRDGIVEFIDKDGKIPFLLRRDKKTDTVKVDVLGMDLSSMIKIDENTKLTIVIDPVSGDRLKIQGGGEIRADIDPTGRVNMNGLYTIKKGDYELKLYNLVKRKFALENGSKLVWNGAPLEAKMDIKGIYTAKASPLGLLGEQVSNMSAEEQNKFKKRIPFKVYLILGGEILKPDISFKIELPEDQKSNAEGAVANKLAQLNQDESELNRQVFSLIILKRFYTQSPTSGSGGGSYAARESVSQILTQQLNNLSDKYVKGVNVELSVDSYNDYSTEGELEGTTDLNLALSKNLFNDRVTVRVNGDFNVEDKSPSSSSGVAGDASVEYKITEDGKYRLKIFRKDEYKGIIEGEYVETGVSLIYSREFSKFRQLFRREDNKNLKSE